MIILESRNLLNDNQAGFRQNRCTTDQVLKFVQDASDQLHAEGSNHRMIATFYDYEKDFDKVWRDGLIHKIINIRIPRRFVKYVRYFLSSRTTRIEINEATHSYESEATTRVINIAYPLSDPTILMLTSLDPLTIASLSADDTPT